MSRVLVVEDEQHLADGLRFNLEAEGYQVEVAGTGEAAQELLAAEPRHSTSSFSMSCCRARTASPCSPKCAGPGSSPRP